MLTTTNNIIQVDERTNTKWIKYFFDGPSNINKTFIQNIVISKLR